MTVGTVRVLVVDDSAFMRKVISDLVARQPDLVVVGTARDGEEALARVEELDPDVVTLDVEMPRVNGLEALAGIMERSPRPVVMVSSLTRPGAEATVRALSLGAVDFVAKPSGAISLDMMRVAEELWQKIRVAARVPRERLRASAAVKPRGGGAAAEAWVRTEARPVPGGRLSRVVVVGASTGGPAALMEVIPGLPAGLAAGVLVVQHMPAGFTASLARHLDGNSRLPVKEAEEGDVLTDGRVLVAPGNRHLLLDAAGRVALSLDPPEHGVRPAVDVTLAAVARAWGDRAGCAILTGMGMDGAKGAMALRRAGGWVLAQDEATCVVYGMPRAVAEMGQADEILPLSRVAEAIAARVAGRRGARTPLAQAAGGV